jgi:hypothetical protein
MARGYKRSIVDTWTAGHAYSEEKEEEEEESYEDMEWSTRTSTNLTSKSPSQRLSSRSEGPPKLPERPSSRLLPRPVK